MIRKFMRKLFTISYLRTWNKNYKDMASALYVGREDKATVFSTLIPELKINTEYKKELVKSLNMRKINKNVSDLDSQSLLFEQVFRRIQNNKKLSRNIINELKKLKTSLNAKSENNEENGDDLDVRSRLEEELDILKEIINQDTVLYSELEKSFVLPFLNFPNILHKNTTCRNEDIFSLFSKPVLDFKPKSHAEIAAAKDLLFFSDVSPTSYYLTGKLCLLELAINDFFLTRLKEHDFDCCANTDIVKAVVAEACGYKVKENPANIPLEINDADCTAFNQAQFLVGSASLPSFVAMFTKKLINFQNQQPIRLATSGRKYFLKKDLKCTPEPSLYNSLQSKNISALILYSKRHLEESIYTELLMVMTEIYSELGLHFRFLQYSAENLKSEENLAVGIQIYSPATGNYIEVGRISLCGDFISKRLQILENLGNKNATYVNLNYVEVVNVKNLIGVILENNQTFDGDYRVPTCLLPFYIDSRQLGV